MRLERRHPRGAAGVNVPARWPARVVWTCWLLGGLARLIYILVVHPATQHVYSDMQGYIDRATRFAMHAPEGIGDTLYPPGASMMFGALYALDPSWTLAMIVQWLLSLAIMGLVWLIARRVYGPSAAAVALVIATLYFPYLHYASLWLSENGFTALALASVWLLLVAVQSATLRGAALTALAAGVAAGLATAFKNTLLGPLALTGLIYSIHAARHRDRRLLPVTLGVVAGLVLVIAPLSERCTRLNEGRFCLSANNLAMNVLMGHYGEKREFRWIDRERNITMVFTAVESTLRGYTDTVILDFGPYDSARNSALATQWIAEHPVAALSLSLHNAGSLFSARTLWPAAVFRGIDYGAWSQRAFWLLILLPALATLAWRASAMVRLRSDSLPEWLLLAPLLGLIVSVFISIAEVRFRVPFDGLLIVLAAPIWLKAGRVLRGRLLRHSARACELPHASTKSPDAARLS